MDETPDRLPDSSAPARKGLKTEMIVAFTAIIISVMTLFVYIYQARIMAEQQHTSVWPYLEWTTTTINADDQEFYLEVMNKGVGPALVKGSKLTLDSIQYMESRDTVDGKPIGDYRDMIKKLIGKSRHDSLWIMYSGIDGRVLAPSEQVKIFHIKNWKSARIPRVDYYSRLTYSITYGNIYGDCWTTQGSVSEESECK